LSFVVIANPRTVIGKVAQGRARPCGGVLGLLRRRRHRGGNSADARNERKPSAKLPADPSYQRIDLAVFERALNDVWEEPARRLPRFPMTRGDRTGRRRPGRFHLWLDQRKISVSRLKRGSKREDGVMPDNVYKIVELVGSSEASISKRSMGPSRRPVRPSASLAGSR
jgi:hypothetical protein